MKILFISSTRIGDAILSKGILKYLLDTYPHASFTVVCGHLPAPLFADMPRVERLIVLEQQRSLKRWYNLWKECRKTRFDQVIDLRGSLLAYFLSAKKRFVWKKNHSTTHRIQQLASLLHLKETPMPYVHLSKERQDKANELFDFLSSPVIALAPAANWVGKEWPIDRFIELAQRIRKTIPGFEKACFAIFAAPHERDQIQPLYQAFENHEILDCVGRVDLLTSAALLKKCALFIGNDSGLMHLSAAVGTPTFGLFGPSRDEHYAPQGISTDYVRTPESYEELMARHQSGQGGSLMTSLTVDMVLERIQGFVKHCDLKEAL